MTVDALRAAADPPTTVTEAVPIPTLAMLFRLCDALGVKASALIARVEKKRKG
jgi:hypothetical protein